MAEVTNLERVEKLTVFLDKLVFSLAKHWLLLVNLVIAVYGGLPLLAPILMGVGYTRPAEIIYTLYRSQCHQLPQRSFFLFGPQLAYSLETLQELLGPETLATDSLASAFIGNTAFGYKIAYCQRDTATYGSMLLAGIFFGLVRHRLKPLPFTLYLIFLAPWAVDGLAQFPLGHGRQGDASNVQIGAGKNRGQSPALKPHRFEKLPYPFRELIIRSLINTKILWNLSDHRLTKRIPLPGFLHEHNFYGVSTDIQTCAHTIL